MIRAPLIATAALAACAAPPPAADPATAEELAVLLSGTFSSHMQHLGDRTEFDSMRIVALPIWPDRDDGPWLYVEQAHSDNLTRPDRQRVYRLVATDADVVRSDIYTLPHEPLLWSAAWRSASPLGDLLPDELTLREGCSIELHRVAPGRFEGSTDGDLCPSQRAGAAFATADVSVTPRRLSVWYRGYDLAGQQVWGATAGPYRFDKVADTPPER